jgi:hypothetical protein
MQNRSASGGATIDIRQCTEPNGQDVFTPCTENSDCTSTGALCDSDTSMTFLVNLRFGNGGWNPTQDELDEIASQLRRISGEIYDASEGQFFIRQWSIVRNNEEPTAGVQIEAGSCQDESSVPCMDGSDCASGVCNDDLETAAIKGWGEGGKIEVGIRCLTKDYCFAHQFFHYIAGVHDEHVGTRVCGGEDSPRFSEICIGGDANNIFCSDSGEVNTVSESECVQDELGTCEVVQCRNSDGIPSNCLMSSSLDNTIESNGELCFAGNHDQGGITEQTACFAKALQDEGIPNVEDLSCWATIEHNWSDVIEVPQDPVQGPVEGPELDLSNVEVLFPETTSRVVLVIDRSGSMITPAENPTRIQHAVNAVKDISALLSVGTELGIVSFSSESSKDFPIPELGLRTIVMESDRTEAQGQAEGLLTRASGRTNISSGLSWARVIMLEGGAITTNSRVILLTDGINNEPSPNANQVLNDTVSGFGIPIDVTCIGQARDSTQCFNIASRTGGTFVDSPLVANVYDAFVDFVAKVEGSGIAGVRDNVEIQPGQVIGDISVNIEPGVEQARFIVSWSNADNDLDLHLFDPDGVQVPLESRIIGTQGEFYRIEAPVAGIWRMEVHGTNIGTTTERLSTRVLLDNPALDFDVTMGRSVIEFPEAFTITANPTFGRSVTGCEVLATVNKPDGTSEQITLVDDGTDADGAEDDGLYGVEFDNFTGGSGIYTFVVTANCPEAAAGLVGSGATAPFAAFAESTTATVPTFERTLRFSGMVTGVPDPVAAICSDIRTECQGPLTVVTLDGTCSFDIEGEPLSYHWSSATGVFDDSSAAMPTASFPAGTNSVELTVTDTEGTTSPPDTAVVTVTDTLAPVIYELSASPDELWSPDHSMVPVTVTVDVEDACDPNVFCEIISVTSNEPIDDTGDGNTDPDWELTGPLSVNLRSERAGGGDGRSYTLDVSCTDITGFYSTLSTEVTVCHDQGT